MLLALLVGLASGLRSLTPAAVVAWAARLGALDLNSSPLAFVGSRTAVTILTLLALGELVFDKLPSAPNRTDLPGLVARVLLGGLSGAAVAGSAGSALAVGAALGAIGGLAGAFAGYQARTRLVRRFPASGLVVALAEDAIAITASVVVVTLS